MTGPPAQSPGGPAVPGRSAPAETGDASLAGLLLAAGAARRFGSPKALHVHGGEPLVVRAARRLLASCTAGVVVVTGTHHDDIKGALAELPVDVVFHSGWAQGLGTSIAAAVPALPAADGVLILPCDLPAVTGDDLTRLATAWRSAPLRVAAAAFAGGPGPPAIIPAAMWGELMSLTGDRGARALIGSRGVPLLVPMDSAALDVDTPADLERLPGPVPGRS